ncbi:MAG TPA: LLM class flavin-dependent oxidoreductase [Gemmatimonadaceae bacterium]|nr:LLM class flavin-dependent oxidoreductase [Gemmatimonadaceae bacterium]
MRFSLLIEIQIDHPTPASERQAFRDAVEQGTLADALGYHCVWVVEHHGLYEYSHCSAPEIVLAFLAARTSRIRLGHAVTLTPYRYNHPIRVAERIATLDVLSEGRVSWGSGKSSSLTERSAFEIDREALDSQWREALEMIPRMWRDDVFEWNGTHFHIPPTAIVPKPVQVPHPPIFVACSRPESIVLAGELGVGALTFAAGDQAFLSRAVRSYRAAMHTAVESGAVSRRRANNQFCCTPNATVLGNDRAACEYGFRGARFFREGLGTYFLSPTPVVGTLDIPRDPLPPAALDVAMRARGTDGGQALAIIGDPGAAREAVSRFRDAGVDELILVMQMGTVPNAIVLESMRTMAERVIPHFA